VDTEAAKNEIVALLEKMGFSKELEKIEIHEGITSRISLHLYGLGQVIEGEGERDSERISPSSMLIGEYGANLAALEYLLKKILQNKYKDLPKFTLDINEYRVKRLEDLKQDIKSAAKGVRLYKKEVPLRPMSAFERRIVHLLLAEYPDITTESIGEEPNRRVIIKPYP
jgi:spoIIIJ-associated protein